MLLERISRKFAEMNIPYAIVGGFAVALHGAVRGTIDIDLIVKWKKKTLVDVAQALKELGLESRLPITAGDIFDFRDEYVKNRNLIAWSFINPQNPVEQVDIIITEDLSSMDVNKIRAGKFVFPVLSINALIKMKKKSGRPQDIEDIKSLEKILKESKK